MLTKMAMTAVMATIGTAAVSAPALAHEHDGGARDGGYANNGYGNGYGYDHDQRERGNGNDQRERGYQDVRYGEREGGWRGEHERRDAFARMQRERREAAFRHAEWLRTHRGWGW